MIFSDVVPCICIKINRQYQLLSRRALIFEDSEAGAIMIVRLVFGDHGEAFAIRLIVLLFYPGVKLLDGIVLIWRFWGRPRWDEGVVFRLRLLEVILLWLSLLPIDRLARLG